jgi:hypothetical protein
VLTLLDKQDILSPEQDSNLRTGKSQLLLTSSVGFAANQHHDVSQREEIAESIGWRP